MNENKKQHGNETGLFLIPNFRLEAIEQAQAEILAILKSKEASTTELNSTQLGFVDEKKAKELLGRKTTWFWKMRDEGKLPYSKVGGKVFYALDDLKKLVNEGGVI